MSGVAPTTIVGGNLRFDFHAGSSGFAGLHDPRALGGGIRDQAFEPRVVTLGDDRGVIGVVGIGAEHALHVGLQLVGEILHRIFRHQRVVGRDAGLAGIEQLAIGDARGGFSEIGGSIDDGGRFAAEFQRDRCQVAAGGFRHESADRGSIR